MSYNNNITVDNIEVNYFVHFCVRTSVDRLDWTDEGGGEFSTPWDKTFPLVIRAIDASLNITFFPAASRADYMDINDSYIEGFYFDKEEQLLYVKFTPYFGNPTTVGVTVYVEYPYNLATKDVGWYVDPTNSNFPTCQYHGLIVSLSDINISVGQSIYGFLPANSGSMTVYNENNIFTDALLDNSVNRSTFNIYRCVGDITTDNMKLVFRGYTRNLSMQGKNLSVSFVDISSRLDNEVFPATRRMDATYPPELIGACHRVWGSGSFERMNAICSSYNETLSTSNNRTWTMGITLNELLEVINPVVPVYPTSLPNSGSNTTTRTYVDTLNGLSVGDWVNDNGDDQALHEVTAIDTTPGSFYVEVTPALVGALSAGESLRKCWLQGVKIIKKSDLTPYTIDITDLDTISNVTGGLSFFFTFKTTIEATYSLNPELNTVDYLVACDFSVGLGGRDFLAIGDPLGSASSATGWYQNPVTSVYELLYRAGFKDWEIYYNQSSFEAAANAVDVGLAWHSPRDYNSFANETFREVLSKICETCLLKLYVKDGKWHIDLVEPLGATNFLLSRANVKGDLTYEINGEEITSSVQVKYAYADINNNNELSQDSFSTSTTSDTLNTDIGMITKKSRILELYLDNSTDAATMRDRYLYLFSRPLRNVTLSVDKRNFNITLGDVVEISATDFPGLPFSTNIKFSVLSIRESEDSLTLELFDQTGIEENSGSW